MAELTVPRIDFTPLGQLGQVYQKAQQDALRRDTLSSLGQGPIDAAAAQKLIASGDMNLAQLGLGVLGTQQTQARDARDFAFRQDEARRAQQNADRSFDFTRSQAKEKPTIQKIKDANGEESLVQVLPDGTVRPLNAPGATGGAAAGNPFGPGKFNEGQGKAAGFADRMLQSEALLTGGQAPGGIGPVQSRDVEGANLMQRNLSKVPVAGNYMVSQPYQEFSQAKADFINAQMRRESGAAISPSEFENADKQYFPMPGDSQATIEQKRANRRAAVEAMGREGGGSYRPKMVYGEDGLLKEYSAKPAQRQPAVAASVSPQHIEALRANPQRAAEFDAKFGAGAAARVLGGQ